MVDFTCATEVLRFKDERGVAPFPTGSLVSSRLHAKDRHKRSKRACSPKLRTLVTTSLVEVREEVDDGAYALSADRMCGGETVMEQSSGLELDCGAAAAMSMAPRRTSNNARTSPVCEAIFFVNKVNAGVGRNRFTAFSTTTSSNMGERRVRRMPNSCSGEYGEK